MTGVVLPGGRRVEFRTVRVPVPGPRQVLVRMRASALCGSDLRVIYRPTEQGQGPEAYRGVIAGHEPCGDIEAVGADVDGWVAGDRVILYHIAGCGRCEDCAGGWMVSCTGPERAAYGWQRDGGHAEYLLAEASTLVHLPERLTHLDGALIACGYGTAYAACLRAGVGAGERVLVTGLGPVGLGAALLCQAMGAEVIGVEPGHERAAQARRLGVPAVVTAGDGAADAVLEHFGGHPVDASLECSSTPSGRLLCLTALRRWGRAVWIGEGGSVTLEPSPLLIHEQRTVHGSWVCSIDQMRDLTARLVEWGMHPESIVSHRFPLEQARAAYETFDSGTTGKVALVWDP
jgi:threonine dehydrogenase-like Zn-dependent dehydrogenase